jgi:hypothetical protein
MKILYLTFCVSLYTLPITTHHVFFFPYKIIRIKMETNQIQSDTCYIVVGEV